VCQSGPTEFTDFPPWDHARKLLNHYLLPLLQPELAEARRRNSLFGLPIGRALYRDDTLVINLRGAEILEDWHPVWYMQPPCGHFVRVLSARQFATVVVVTDDAAHPCFPALRQAHPSLRSIHPHATTPSGKAVVPGDMLTLASFATMMSARHLALSTASSFGLGAMLLSPAASHVDVYYPAVSTPLCCDMMFRQDRLEQLCAMGSRSQISVYAMPDGWSRLGFGLARWMAAPHPEHEHDGNASARHYGCPHLAHHRSSRRRFDSGIRVTAPAQPGREGRKAPST